MTYKVSVASMFNKYYLYIIIYFKSFKYLLTNNIFKLGITKTKIVNLDYFISNFVQI